MGEEYQRKIYVVGQTVLGGPVILADGIEDRMNWGKSGTGADFDVTRDTTGSCSGAAQMKMVSRVTDPAEGDHVAAQLSTHFGVTRKVLFDCRFRFQSKVNTRGLTFCLHYYGPLGQKDSYLRYAPSEARWEYYEPGEGQYDPIPGGGYELQQGAWHRVRFEIDFSGLTYGYLMADSVLMDISDLVLNYPDDTPMAEYTRVEFVALTATANQITVFIDDVLLLEV